MLDFLMQVKENCPLLLALGVFAFLLWQNRFLHRQIDDYREIVEVLRFERDYDLLSGLKNRNAFLRFSQQQEKAAALVSLLVCDIDGLKLINDKAGHNAGDKVIKKAGNILRRACPSDACAFRTGGDEYVIVIKTAWTADALQSLKGRIQSEIVRHNEAAANMPLSLSVGVAAAADSEGIGSVYNRADRDMYCEKRSHQENVYQMLRLALVAE